MLSLANLLPAVTCSAEGVMACMAALAGISVSIGESGTPVSPTASALCSSSSSSASLFLRSSIHSGTVSLSARREETRRFSPLLIRAVSSDDSTPDAAKQFEELYTDLKAKVSYSCERPFSCFLMFAVCTHTLNQHFVS